MSATSSTFWFWSDWLGDQDVRRLTPAARGVWVDLFALAVTCQNKGYVCDHKNRPLPIREIARFSNCTESEAAKYIEDIIEKKAISRNRAGCLFFPMMTRDGSHGVRPDRSKWARLRKLAFERDGFTCVYCGEKNEPLECDHVRPISRGGSNKLKNLAAACRSCNQSKSDRLPEEWRR